MPFSDYSTENSVSFGHSLYLSCARGHITNIAPCSRSAADHKLLLVMGRSPCCDKEGLKKGPWTQEEDQKLIAFVTEHGHGNWRSLPNNCGLLRCGKSCRLRWINYLRPDIKRGLFTASEEQTILQLQALVGNKWAFIASQLPKRTDNEVKNYWNTVLKKRLERVHSAPFATTMRITSGLTLAAMERQNGEDKSLCKSGALNKKPSGSIISSPATSMNCAHLAQWESARLEAETRLAKESQSKRTHKITSFNYFSSQSFAATTTITPPPTTSASAMAAFPFLSCSDTNTATTFPSFPTTNSAACSTALSSFPNVTSALSLDPSLSSVLQHTLQQPLDSFLLNPLKSMTSTDSKVPCSLLHHTCTNYYHSPTPSLILPANNSPSQALPSSLYLSTTSSLQSLPSTSSLRSPVTSSSTLSSFSLPATSFISTPSSLMLPISSLSNTSSLFSPISLSLPDIHHMPSYSSSVSNNSSKSSRSISSKASTGFSSEKTIPSVLCLVPRLSSQATSPLTYSGTSQAAFLSQMLCKNINDQHGIHTVKLLSASESKGDRGSRDRIAKRADLKQTNLDDTSSSMSTSMVNSLDSWHDLLFDVENSCSDVVSTS